MIDVKALHRRFGTVEALRGVDLIVEAGELVALMGPSGSGKTTLLGIIGGLDRPDAGSVCVGGMDIGALSGRELAGYRLRQVGFVFQSPGLMPLMTALENVVLPLHLIGRDERSARGLAEDALEMVGLGERSKHRAYELSGGEQQRVGLARALAKQPKLLLADEPTGQLDSETSAQIVDLIASIRGQATILLATHDETVAAHADRSLYMEDGTLARPRQKSG